MISKRNPNERKGGRTSVSTLLKDCGEPLLAGLDLQALAGSYVDRLETFARARSGGGAPFDVKQIGERSGFDGCPCLVVRGGRHFDPRDICSKVTGCTVVGRSLRHLHAEILALFEVPGGGGNKHGEDAVGAVVGAVDGFLVRHHKRHLQRLPAVSIQLGGGLCEVLLDHGFPWITVLVGVHANFLGLRRWDTCRTVLIIAPVAQELNFG